jgi:hypothetical protein
MVITKPPARVFAPVSSGMSSGGAREVRRSTPEEMPLQAKKAFNKTTPFRDFRDWRHTVQVERFEIWWLPVAHEKIRAFLFFA